ncbi:hypothetical protein DRO33_05425, partial [Candidatus Bathyarchaeota archaeon]
YEVEKQTYFPRLFLNGEELREGVDLASIRVLEVRPLRPVDVEVAWAPGLVYRLYIDEEATEEDLAAILREALGPDIRIVGPGVMKAHKRAMAEP